MKKVFYTISDEAHWKGARGDEFCKSFRYFHPTIDLVNFGEVDIERHFKKHPELNFYNCKAYFARLLYSEYDLVVNIDIDHLILGELTAILAANYQVAAPANYNVFANAFIDIVGVDGKQEKFVPSLKYFQGGLIASTSNDFWDNYHFASIKHSAIFHYKENDVLNMLLTMLPYKSKYLEGHYYFADKDFKEYYGCASLGREKEMRVRGNQIVLDGRPVKAYHFARGGMNKPHPKELFTDEVTSFIYNRILK